MTDYYDNEGIEDDYCPKCANENPPHETSRMEAIRKWLSDKGVDPNKALLVDKKIKTRRH